LPPAPDTVALGARAGRRAACVGSRSDLGGAAGTFALVTAGSACGRRPPGGRGTGRGGARLRGLVMTTARLRHSAAECPLAVSLGRGGRACPRDLPFARSRSLLSVVVAICAGVVQTAGERAAL